METAVVATAERGLAAAIVDRYAHFSTFSKITMSHVRMSQKVRDGHITPDCDWVPSVDP